MKKLHLLIFLTLSLSILGFSQEEFQQQINKQETEYLRYYFEAEQHKLLEDYTQAMLFYEKCISINPEESAAYNEIAKISFYLQDWENAHHYINQAISLNPNNKWYYYLLIDIFTVQNQLLPQVDIYSNLIKIEPSNYWYYLQKINLLKSLKLYKKAIKQIRQANKVFGTSLDLLIELSAIYLLQDNFKEAQKISLQLINKFPNNPDSYNALGAVYLHFSKYEEAISLYEELLTILPNSPIAITALHQIYTNKKDVKNQEKYLLKIVQNKEINIETKRELLYTLLLQSDFEKYASFKKIVETVLQFAPQDPLVNLVLADIYAKEKQYNKALSHYQLSFGSAVVKDQYVYNKIIEIYFQKKEYDLVIKTCDEGIEKYPFSPRLYYLKALSLVNIEDYGSALEILLNGKNMVIDDSNLSSEFYALIGDVHHALNDHKKSDLAYTKSLEYNPDNVFVLNNYSYYLALRNENLEQAYEMIKKCDKLTQDSPNASFLDTYAWVLYKMQKYKEAKDQINKAILLNTNSATLFEHSGDILYELGEVHDAIIAWRKALNLDPDNPSIQQKIRQNE